MGRTWEAAVVCLVILLSATVVYGIYHIVSPRITVVVQEYSLTLNANVTACVVSDAVRFYGNLTKDGAPIQNVVVTLYYGNDTSTGLTGTTALDGSYWIVWAATQQGSFEFYTEANIP